MATRRLRITSSGEIDDNHSKWRALDSCTRDLTDDDGRVVGVMKIKLPFQCEENLYSDGRNIGEVILLYEHDIKEYREKNQFHYIWHVELISEKRECQRRPRFIETRVVGAVLESGKVTNMNPFAGGNGTTGGGGII